MRAKRETVNHNGKIIGKKQRERDARLRYECRGCREFCKCQTKLGIKCNRKGGRIVPIIRSIKFDDIY